MGYGWQKLPFGPAVPGFSFIVTGSLAISSFQGSIGS
jgi:hypothetical protein